MNRIHWMIAVGGLAIAGGLTSAAYFAGVRHGASVAANDAHLHPVPAADGGRAGVGTDAPQRKVLYWHDPMVPSVRFDQPGRSPFMAMDLVPVYADEAGDAAGPGVKISTAVLQNLGLRLAPVRRAPLASSVEAVGTITPNERATVTVQTRVTGYVEKLHVRAALDPVSRGQPLATIYAPEWAGALTEYLALRDANVDRTIVAAARERLRLLSIPDDVVARSEQQGAAQTRFEIAAPIPGVVAELGIREGEMAAPGMPLFRLLDLSTVWAVVEVPEAQLSQLGRGAAVQARADAYPARVFDGRLSAVLPQVERSTRTAQARIELANPGQVLKPGMFVRATITPAAADAGLVVPQEAVIATGKRDIVVVAHGGRFEPVEVEVGRVVGGDVEVRRGLTEGQQVVASGQFLIDSEASLRSALPRLANAAAATGAAGTVHSADGVFEGSDGDEVMLSHGPVPSLKWPPMTMGFRKPADGKLPALQPGDRIRFDFIERAGEWQLTRIERTGAPR